MSAKHIGTGAENHCYHLPDRDTVVKTNHLFGKFWQNTDISHIERCLAAIAKHGIKAIQTRVVKNCRFHLENEYTVEADHGLETPFIPDIEDQKVGFQDLADPETGAQNIREVAEFIRKADQLYAEDLGLDLVGGKIFSELARVFKQTLLEKLSHFLPETISHQIREKLEGVDIKLDNLIKTPEGIILTDIGMYDFSEQGKFQPLLRSFHNIFIAGMIQILKEANQLLPIDQRVKAEELDLPFNGNDFEQKLATKLVKATVPLLTKNRKGAVPKFETAPIPNTA